MIRPGYVIAVSFGTLALAVSSFVPLPVKLIWNASASTPVGLYALAPASHLEEGDLVAVMPPKRLAEFMTARGYIGRGVPLLKHIAALPGQRICRIGPTVTVDGVPFGDALRHDRLGRGLPVWQGCRRVAKGELFLMNPSVADSFDGRYFGPLPARGVIGRATPLYTDEDDNGRFAWFAATR
jgi:conjugative transfer signal peptidase TraF